MDKINWIDSIKLLWIHWFWCTYLLNINRVLVFLNCLISDNTKLCHHYTWNLIIYDKKIWIPIKVEFESIKISDKTLNPLDNCNCYK